MSFEEAIDKYRLIRKVETSDSDENTENDVNAAIKEATDILKAAYKSEKSDIVNSFRKEYEDLRQSVVDSLHEDRKITKNELTKIKLELSDVTKLAESHDVDVKTSTFGKVSNFLTGADLKGISKKAQVIKEKNIDKYSKNDAMGALEYLNGEYRKQYKESSVIGKIFNRKDESISKLDDRGEVRIFQEELIKIILGNEKGYNNEYILSFDDKEGNKLVKLSDYQEKLNNTSEPLNLATTATYISYLKENSSDKDDFNNKIGENFKGEEGIIRLEKILNMGDSDAKDNAIGILKENGLIEKGHIVMDFLSKLFKKFNNLLSSLDKFIEGADSLSPEEGKKFIKYLKENKDNSKIKFKTSLLEKFDGIEDKESIVESLLNELLQAENVGEMYTIIDTYEEEHKVKLDKKTTAQSTIEQKYNKTRIDYLEAKEEGDEDKMVAAQEDLISYDEQSIINENVTEKEVEEIVEKLKAGEKFEDIIVEISKKNKKLDEKLKESKEKYKKIREEKNIKNNEETIKEIEKTEDVNEKDDYSKRTYTYAEGGNITMKISDKKSLKITEKEQEKIDKNPDFFNNLINFHNILTNLNLESVWDYRKELVTSMQDVNINLEDDFLSESEIVKVGNNLIKFINNLSKNNGEKTKLSKTNTLSGVKNQLKIYSKANGVLSNNQTFNSYGDDILGNHLRQLKITGDGYFKMNKFNDVMKGKNINSNIV